MDQPKSPSFFRRMPLIRRVLLAIFLALIVTLVFTGLDNEVGIVLAWATVTVLLVELTRRWRRMLNFYILAAG